MQNWETLGKALQGSGKGSELRKLAESAEGQRLGAMLDEQAARQAAESGDPAALKKLLSGVLSTEEGRRLASRVQQLLGR